MKKITLMVSAIATLMAGSALTYAAVAQDHVITRAEAQQRAGKLFDRLDANHDGKLDSADRAARLNSFFDKIDTNHDGVISRDEFLAAHEHEQDVGVQGLMKVGHDGDRAALARVDRRAAEGPLDGPRGSGHVATLQRHHHAGASGGAIAAAE